MNGGIVTANSASERMAAGDVMVKTPDDRASLAKPPELAEYLGKTVQGLAVWRMNGVGPKFIKFENGSIRYRWSDVDAWLAAQEVGGAA